MRNLVARFMLAVSLVFPPMIMTAACGAHVPPALQVKATATYTARDLGNALDAAYRLELSAVASLPPAVQLATIGAQQNKVLDLFAKAFDGVAVVAHDLQAIKPGDAVPDSLNGVLATVKDLLAEVKALPLDSNAKKVVDAVTKVIDLAIKIAEKIRLDAIN